MAMDAPSPLVMIRQKEIEIAECLAAAKKASEVELNEAHQSAAEYREQAEQLDRDHAAGDYRRRLAEVDAEATAILAEAERAAALATSLGQCVMPAAVAAILNAVLPEAVPCS